MVPQKGWCIMETPIKMDDLGVPLFSETSTKPKTNPVLLVVFHLRHLRKTHAEWQNSNPARRRRTANLKDIFSGFLQGPTSTWYLYPLLMSASHTIPILQGILELGFLWEQKKWLAIGVPEFLLDSNRNFVQTLRV